MRAERVELTRIADALEALLIIMSDDDVTPVTPSTPDPEPTQPEPVQTLAQMVATCRSGLIGYKARGGDPIALISDALKRSSLFFSTTRNCNER